MKMAALLFHKNPISARLRLLKFSDGGVIGPERPTGTGVVALQDQPTPHPGALVSALRDQFDIAASDLQAHASPVHWMDDVAIFAVECTATEPPQTLAEKLGGEWVDFTAVRTFASDDQNAARNLYTHVIG